MTGPWPAVLDPRARNAQLSMLEALARSQTAVARMLECAADAAEEARLPAALIRRELRALAELQAAMRASVTGAVLRRVKRGGPPAPPWLHSRVGRGTVGTARSAGRRPTGLSRGPGAGGAIPGRPCLRDRGGQRRAGGSFGRNAAT